MKIGRNDPCTCGSGNKYKKCCLLKEAATAKQGLQSQMMRQQEYQQSQPSPATDVSPYACSIMIDRGVVFAGQSRTKAEMRQKWSPAKLRPLSTEDIVGRLHAKGIAISQDEYRLQSVGILSAWDIGVQWLAKAKARRSVDDTDFINLAACELWRRFCPEKVSLEMVDDWMQEGYDLQRDSERACEIWDKVWEYFKTRFTPDMRSTEDVDPIFGGLQCFSNWVQDFEMELGNAARRNRSYVTKGLLFLDEFFVQFPAEDDHQVRNFRRDRVAIYCAAKDMLAAENEALALIQDWPDFAAGYLAMSEVMEKKFNDGEKSAKQQQLDWLQKANAKSVVDRQDYDLDIRIDYLRSELN